MSLIEKRGKCLDALESYTEGNWNTLRPSVEAWWKAYKKWEKGDTWKKAREEGRLTIRVYNPPDSTPSTKWETSHTSSLGKDSVKKAQVKHGDQAWDVSARGIYLRTIPSNCFEAPVQMAAKYQLGLHDLSASLLKPNVKISEQLYLRLDNGKNGAFAVFMPLPDMADLFIYDTLETLTKSPVHNVGILFLMRDIRSRMTRLAQAHHADMGAKAFASKPDSKSFPKFGYGASDYTGEDKLRGVNGNIGAQGLLELKKKAVWYKEILAKQTTRYNEIVIAYREHANKKEFPKFAQWDFDQKKYKVLSLVGKNFVDTIEWLDDKAVIPV